jgi:replication factor A1
MITMPYEQMLEKICAESKLSKDQITQKIREKLDQLTNLVSKEGAAHIVANELGVKLFDATGGKMKIHKILSGMRNLEVLGKVQRIFEVREFSTEKGAGKVGSLIVADDTDSIRVTCWHAQADKISRLNQGDVVLIKGAYVRENQGKKELHLNDRSELIINPPGQTVEVNEELVKKRAVPTRKQISELSDADSNVELLGTVVQAYDLRFFETCPDCRKRLKQKESGLECEQHGTVKPEFGYVLNIFVDDGSDNIRAVFFRQQVEKLLGRNYDQVIAFREFPDKFEEVKHELLGQIVKLSGRASKNAMFDRLEFVVNEVVVNPSPDDELQRLNGLNAG